jgi:hypothetical protein
VRLTARANTQHLCSLLLRFQSYIAYFTYASLILTVSNASFGSRDREMSLIDETINWVDSHPFLLTLAVLGLIVVILDSYSKKFHFYRRVVSCMSLDHEPSLN